MGYRLRTEALQFILDNVKLFTTSASHFDVFPKLIGYKPATVKSQAFYDRFEVPILHPMMRSSMIFLVKHGRPSSALLAKRVSPALCRTTTKTTGKAGHPRLPHPRIHATSLQAHRNCHSAPSPMVSSTIKPIAHHLPDADYYSFPCLGFKMPTCTTRKCKLAILIPTGCSREPLSQQRVAWTVNCSVVAAIIYFYI
ncbi:hypothetical protein B0H13DRAFT_2309474 [Mycena leptocephala]|nr:hypothetical protein B0H13DRAFT_2309474 [Mycena leptocephala]